MHHFRARRDEAHLWDSTDEKQMLSILCQIQEAAATPLLSTPTLPTPTLPIAHHVCRWPISERPTSQRSIDVLWFKAESCLTVKSGHPWGLTEVAASLTPGPRTCSITAFNRIHQEPSEVYPAAQMPTQEGSAPSSGTSVSGEQRAWPGLQEVEG